MYRLLPLLLLTMLCASCTAQPQRVILDTDIDSDVDDVQALAMLHAYADMGSVDLLGVVVTSEERYAASCTDAINTFYGRPDLPIGYLRHRDSLRQFSKYTRQVTEEFPHRIEDSTGTVASAQLYRQLLADSPDGSVTIVTVGHLSSLAAFLQSPADAISPLTGQELARKKVSRWLCMGGRYPEGKEANFYRPDPASTAYCLDHWLGEAIFCGWEVGNEILTGGAYLKQGLTPPHPVFRAYQLYNDFAGRPAWDQVAVLLLDDRAHDFFELVRDGYVAVNAAGENRWVAGAAADKQHAYVRIRPEVAADTIARYIDGLIINATPK
ncbi:nucleoside hydrolase [Neolewinella sp.]|uniref:nucleoside hydrolase n=1 Tax=Neolewinella sp. TaxID=2993543 RepID=UPI003B52DC9A